MNYAIIVCTFFLSAYVAIRVMKSTRDQWLGMAAALVLNSFILGVSAWLLLRTDEQVRLFGIDHANRYTLIIALPIMTWVHFLLLSYVRDRMGRRKNEGRA